MLMNMLQITSAVIVTCTALHACQNTGIAESFTQPTTITRTFITAMSPALVAWLQADSWQMAEPAEGACASYQGDELTAR